MALQYAFSNKKCYPQEPYCCNSKYSQSLLYEEGCVSQEGAVISVSGNDPLVRLASHMCLATYSSSLY